METVASRTTIHSSHLPNIAHQHVPPKKDFTRTFQRVAPLLFVFLLGLSIYTKYRMSSIKPIHVSTPVHPEGALLPITSPPWQSSLSSLPRIEVNIGERKWEELKRTLHGTEQASLHKGKDACRALHDVADNCQAKWECLKRGTERELEKAEEQQERLLEPVETGVECLSQVVDEEVIHRVHVGKQALEDAMHWGKEKAQAGLESFKESVDARQAEQHLTEVSKELYAEATEKLADFAAHQKARGEYWTELGKEKVQEWKEYGKELKEELVEAGKELGQETLQSTKAHLEHAKHFAEEEVNKTLHDLQQVGASLSEKVETLVGSIKDIIPALHISKRPSYLAVCPVLGRDMCPASTNTTNEIW